MTDAFDRLQAATLRLVEAETALRRIAACPNPDSVNDCHNQMSDIAKEYLATHVKLWVECKLCAGRGWIHEEGTPHLSATPSTARGLR